jgi:erythromycin esterase-like protein
MTRRLRRLSTGLWLLPLLALGSNAQESPKPAVPIDPVGAILTAFGTHQIVSLTEGAHGNEQSHDFRMTLIQDPRFAAVANDIVVEFGNSRYQDLMDRFVNGGDVPYAQLRHVWQDTTQPHDVWDRPIYEQFFRAIRRINGSLSDERRISYRIG